MSAEVDVERLRELLAAATPGPWEVGDYWHVQGAKWCRCDAGPLVWSGKRDINGTRMEAHVHRRDEPIGNDIMQADASDGDPANISYATDYGPGVEDNDAALIAAAVNALPALLDLAERVRVVEGERDECLRAGEEWQADAYRAEARADSAEAAHAALVAKVEALADEWEAISGHNKAAVAQWHDAAAWMTRALLDGAAS